MNAVWQWISGWYETLCIRIFEPELYRDLTESPLDLADFFEVTEPGDD